MRNRSRIIIFVFVIITVSGLWRLHPRVSAITGGAASTVAEERARRLRHGINASHWFAQVFKPEGYTKPQFESFTTDDDIALINQMGFDHVRLSIEPAPMFQETGAASLPGDYLGYIDAAIAMIVKHGLAAIVDVHPGDDFKLKLNKDNVHVEAFARFWRAFAAHLSRTDPDMVFLEALNEPMVEDGYRWWGIQARLVAAMREGAPRHTIIATGHRWSGLDQMVELEPVADANVIYNFHYYEPMAMTHQGANWAGPAFVHLRTVPYPSSPELVAPLLSSLTDEAAKRALARYGREEWNAERIDHAIAKVAAWAERHRVPVTCNEFGVFRRVALPEARASWLRDVRTALEKYGVGWTMWDYQGGFSVVNKVGGKATPDQLTLAALGLTNLTGHNSRK